MVLCLFLSKPFRITTFFLVLKNLFLCRVFEMSNSAIGKGSAFQRNSSLPYGIPFHCASHKKKPLIL